MEASKMKVVYVITQRAGRKFWNRIGAAFVNGDGSLNVKLDAMPVTGELHIRDFNKTAEDGTQSGVTAASSFRSRPLAEAGLA